MLRTHNTKNNSSKSNIKIKILQFLIYATPFLCGTFVHTLGKILELSVDTEFLVLIGAIVVIGIPCIFLEDFLSKKTEAFDYPDTYEA